MKDDKILQFIRESEAAAGKAPVLLNQPKPNMVIVRDEIDERKLRLDGRTYFFVPADKSWCKATHDLDVTGATVLGATNAEGTRWGAVIGARVVLRIRVEGHEIVGFDCCTGGDGATAAVPSRFATAPTPFGPTYHAAVFKGCDYRVEVEAGPGYGEALVRVVLHGRRAES